MKNRRIVKAGDNYRGYRLPTGKRCNTYYEKTLSQSVDLIEAWSANKTRVVVRRIDIRNSGDKILSGDDQRRFLERMKKNISHREKLKGRDGTIGWLHVTEQTSVEKNPHMHFVFFGDGNTFRNGHGIYEEAVEQTKNFFGEDHASLVEEGQCVVLDRNSDGFLQQKVKAFEMCSYLAKTASKEHRGRYSRISSRSRLPQNRNGKNSEN